MGFIGKIYRSVLPESFRRRVLALRRKGAENRLKQEVLNYYSENPSQDTEINSALGYLRSNDLSVFPFPFFNKYKTLPVEVKRDVDSGLPYVIHAGRKLFFKRSWSNEHIISAYRFLRAEQDPDSAHCYLTEQYTLGKDAVVVDVGAAEGIFAIAEIESIRHLYLVETDAEWIEALDQTFRPWKDKVTIINKFISDKNDARNMTLDSYFSNTAIDFLKIDVDGAEEELLRGADAVVSAKVKKLAICTYHKQDDQNKFDEMLKRKGYQTHFSKGYMLFFFDENFHPPYFRRGLIRAEKI